MILVTGATGQLGRLTIEALLRTTTPDQIVAGVRDFAKAQDLKKLGIGLREADYQRPQHWPAALRGIDHLILISSSEVGQRVRQHQTVIDAARAAGTVKRLIYTSLLHAPTSPISLAPEHRATEEAIVKSGIPHVMMRNSWYLENYEAAIDQGMDTGQIYGAAGDGRIGAASRADFAAALAKVATMTEQPRSVYELAGDKGFTMTELAAAVSRAASRPVEYVNMTEDEYRDMLVQVGLPKPIAVMLASADAGIAHGALDDPGRDLSGLIGRPTTSLTQIIRSTSHPEAH